MGLSGGGADERGAKGRVPSEAAKPEREVNTLDFETESITVFAMPFNANPDWAHPPSLHPPGALKTRMPQFELHADSVSLTWRNGKAEIPVDQIFLAHFGCRLLGTLATKDKKLISDGEGLTQEQMANWDAKFGNRPAWRDAKDSVGRLAETLRKAAVSARCKSVTLWDTMRRGSDYWRPGKLLTDAANQLAASEVPVDVDYHRREDLCPPVKLLDKFKQDTQMSFGEYARHYAEHLRGKPELIEQTAARLVLELALGHLTVFYCTDPFIPDYSRSDEMLRVPYSDRYWLPTLRDEGCHRVILTEEIIRFFLNLGLRVKLLEIDQTFDRVLLRQFSPSDLVQQPV